MVNRWLAMVPVNDGSLVNGFNPGSLVSQVSVIIPKAQGFNAFSDRYQNEVWIGMRGIIDFGHYSW